MATKIADEKVEAREAIDRTKTRAERQRARYGDDDDDPELSLYIRIAESAIYPWKPTLKAVLKEIAYLRVSREKNRPFGRDPKIPYVGWCWASERTLAERCGCSERTIRRAVSQLKEDGVILIRIRRDSHGHLHNEYFIIEKIIKKYELEAEQPEYKRPKCTWQVRKTPHAGRFSKTHQPKRPVSDRSAGAQQAQTVAEASLNDEPEVPADQEDVAILSRQDRDVVVEANAIGQMDREPTDKWIDDHRSDGSSSIGQSGRDPTSHLSAEVGVIGGCFSSSFSTSLSTPPLSASRMDGGMHDRRSAPLNPNTETQNQPQDRGALPRTPAGETPAPPCGGMGVSDSGSKKKRTKCANPNCRGKASPSGTGYCSRCDYERTPVGAKPGEPKPEPVVEEKPARTNGSSPAPKAQADVPVARWKKPEPEKPPKPLRSAFATRQEYTTACCRAGYILGGTPDEREPGVPLPLRSSYKTRYEYELACWHAGVYSGST